MKYKIIKTKPTYGERTPEVVAIVEGLYEAEMLKQKLEKEDNVWTTYELKMC